MPEEHRELRVMSAMSDESMEAFMRRAIKVTFEHDQTKRRAAAQTL